MLNAAVAIVQAMSSHRPYRPALGIKEAIAEIREGAGKRFDAEVVASCIGVLNSGAFTFSEAG